MRNRPTRWKGTARLLGLAVVVTALALVAAMVVTWFWSGRDSATTSTPTPRAGLPALCNVFGVFGDFDDWATYSVANRLSDGADGFNDHGSRTRNFAVAHLRSADVDAGDATPLADWLAQVRASQSDETSAGSLPPPPPPPTAEVRAGARLVDDAIHRGRCRGWGGAS